MNVIKIDMNILIYYYHYLIINFNNIYSSFIQVLMNQIYFILSTSNMKRS